MSRLVGTRQPPGYSITRAFRVFTASPEHLLAMKALAARPRDMDDIRKLVQVLGLHTVDDVLASVREIFPEEEPPARLGLLLKDIFSDQDG